MQDFMANFLRFVIEHWFLWLLLITILVLIIWTELHSLSGGFSKLSAQRAVQLINHQHAVVIDIRKHQSFVQGHIIGARNMPFEEIDKSIEKLQKFKSRPVILVCNMGQQAAKAGQVLRQKGFEKIFILQGGLNAWKQAGMPLEKV